MEFSGVFHTIIVSDLHLSDVELGQPGSSLWKRYKRPKHFIDQSFKRLLDHLLNQIGSQPVELVFNGDIFDFDSVMHLPRNPHFPVSWIEKSRGLFPEEEKSRFKMEVILSDHPVFVNVLREWVCRGNRIVFTFGNHDVELHWPLVQNELLRALQLTPEETQRIRFCEWFYISGGDTVIEHGNQYDDYSVISSPIHPFIRKGERIQVRLPFGNITGRYLINGMGLFNPHSEGSFLMTFPEYVKFVLKYAIRVQPLIVWSWFWGSVATFITSLQDGFKPPHRNPLMIDHRVDEIAHRANSTSVMVRMMNEIKVHSVSFDPLKIARELWLDRMFLLLLIGFVSVQLFMMVRMMTWIPVVSMVGFFMVLVPGLFIYSSRIQSSVIRSTDHAIEHSALITKITGTVRLILGHTHHEIHTHVEGAEVLNTGTWSPAFTNPECTLGHGRKCFAWIKPDAQGARQAFLYEWKDPGVELIPVRPHAEVSRTVEKLIQEASLRKKSAS